MEFTRVTTKNKSAIKFNMKVIRVALASAIALGTLGAAANVYASTSNGTTWEQHVAEAKNLDSYGLLKAFVQPINVEEEFHNIVVRLETMKVENARRSAANQPVLDIFGKPVLTGADQENYITVYNLYVNASMTDYLNNSGSFPINIYEIKKAGELSARILLGNEANFNEKEKEIFTRDYMFREDCANAATEYIKTAKETAINNEELKEQAKKAILFPAANSLRTDVMAVNTAIDPETLTPAQRWEQHVATAKVLDTYGVLKAFVEPIDVTVEYNNLVETIQKIQAENEIRSANGKNPLDIFGYESIKGVATPEQQSAALNEYNAATTNKLLEAHKMITQMSAPKVYSDAQAKFFAGKFNELSKEEQEAVVRDYAFRKAVWTNVLGSNQLPIVNGLTDGITK